MRRLLAAATIVALAACRSEGPADKYQRFAAAARSGKGDAVWSMLSTASRARLDAEAKRLADRAPEGLVPPSGRQLVVGDLAVRAPKIRSAVVLRESPSAAVVEVVDETGAKGQVSLVKEDGEWRVELPAAGGA
jgi:hypothetical protein